MRRYGYAYRGMLLACVAHAPSFMWKAVGGGRAGKQEDAGSDATSTIIHVPIQQGLDVMK